MARPIASRVRENFDWALFAAVGAIAVVGVINLYSATRGNPRLSELYITQIYWLVFGALAAILVAAIDYRHYERLAYVLYGVGVGLLGMTLLVGEVRRGAQRWISFGETGFGFQPSELMKILLVVALAKYLHDHPKQEGRNFRDLVIPSAMAILPIALILLQPDLGTAFILFLAFFTIMLLMRLKLRSFLTLLLVGLVSLPLAWSYLLKGYQQERILSFWNSFVNPSVDMLDSGWHARQSIIAIGSGRLVGKGILQGTQNSQAFLPDRHSDFPFSVWAEEHGFFGGVVVIGLYLFVVLWSLRIATQAKDRFGAVVAVGVGSIFFWHTVLNLGMVMGLLPVVGVTLPLFSFGGSSVLTVLLGVGLLMNVSIRRFHF